MEFFSIPEAEAFAEEALAKAREYLRRGEALQFENTMLANKLARKDEEIARLQFALLSFIDGGETPESVAAAIARDVTINEFAQGRGVSKHRAKKIRNSWRFVYRAQPDLFARVIDAKTERRATRIQQGDSISPSTCTD
jgi:hypothetical protein